MTRYVKKACSQCGIMRSQPDMLQHSPWIRGVNGRLLTPRPKWFCQECSDAYMAKLDRDERFSEMTQVGKEAERQKIRAEAQEIMIRRKKYR